MWRVMLLLRAKANPITLKQFDARSLGEFLFGSDLKADTSLRLLHGVLEKGNRPPARGGRRELRNVSE